MIDTLALLLLLCIQQRSLQLFRLFLPLCFVYLFQLVPAISSPLNTSSLHIQHSNSHLCPLKQHTHGYFVLFFKSIFTRRSCPSVPLHGRTQRSEVGCHYNNQCSCGWDSLLLEDGSDLLHAALLVAVIWPVGLLCVPTQGWHCAAGIGLCSTKWGSTPNNFQHKR